MSGVSFATAGYVCPQATNLTVQVNPTARLDAELRPETRLEALLDDKQFQACPPEPELFAINTFQTPAIIVELGFNLIAPAFTATYVNGVPNFLTLTDDQGNPVTSVVATPNAFNSPFSFQKTTPGAQVLFTLDAALDAIVDQETLTVTWQPRVYTGVTSSPGPYTEAQIEALALQNLAADATLNTTLSPVGQYVVHAYPDSYGPKTPLNFTLGTSGPGDMSEIQTGLPITNPQGESLSYRVARSDNLLDVNLGGGLPIPFIVT